MITDLAEVFRLGTEKAEENLAFRRFLSNHHYPDGPFQILACEVQSRIDCRACANCCRHGEVAVTAADMDAIARRLGTSAAEVERLYTQKEAGAPARHTLLNSEEGCVFLDGNLCLIYEARPRACREFPHITPGCSSLGSRPASQARWAPLCPILFNAIEEYKHATGFHARGGHT